jgi:hypothetical protein
MAVLGKELRITRVADPNPQVHVPFDRDTCPATWCLQQLFGTVADKPQDRPDWDVAAPTSCLGQLGLPRGFRPFAA